jgi:hypothetical protein
MATRNGSTGREQAFSAAVRRFPHAEFAIRRLMNRSEAFCDMCEDLAEAEWALSNVPATPPAIREARKVEWQELVDRLVAEVGTALRENDTRNNPAGQ